MSSEWSMRDYIAGGGRIYALANAQGTACYETVLTADEYTAEGREQVENATCNPSNDDPPIRGTWIDVTDNDALNGTYDEESDHVD